MSLAISLFVVLMVMAFVGMMEDGNAAYENAKVPGE